MIFTIKIFIFNFTKPLGMKKNVKSDYNDDVSFLGLFRLTNVKKGDYYGIAATWSAKKKRQMGAYLLKKAFNIFINEGEHQIRPLDLKVGQ